MLPSLQRSSIPLVPCCGIPVKLHILFPLFLVVEVLLRFSRSKEQGFLSFIILGPFLLVTILLHQLSQCLVARRLQSDVHGILLWPLGGLIFIGHSSTPKVDLLIALVGPFSHLPMIIIWVLILLGVSGNTSLHLSQNRLEDDFLGAMIAAFVVTEILLLVFNLCVPAYPLDGGRIVADSLLLMGVSEETTAKVMIGTSVPMGIVLIIYGFVEFLPVTVMVGLWILYSSWGLISSLRNGTIIEHPLFLFTDDIEVEIHEKGLPSHVPLSSS